MRNRLEEITSLITSYAEEYDMDGYHRGYDEGWDEAIRKGTVQAEARAAEVFKGLKFQLQLRDTMLMCGREEMAQTATDKINEIFDQECSDE